MTNWLYVLAAGLVEILWVFGLKASESALEWAGTIGLIVISFYLIMKATSQLPVATVYAVFTGIGTAGTVVVGMLFLDEPFSWLKIFFIATLLLGVIGLKLVTGEKEAA